MEKLIGICCILFITIFVAESIYPAVCSAWRPEYQQELTDNPKLAEANKLYKKAVKWIEDGNNVHEAERAVQFYATAEAYLRRAAFELKEQGDKYSVDVTKEVNFCEKLERETHSDQGMARKEAR